MIKGRSVKLPSSHLVSLHSLKLRDRKFILPSPCTSTWHIAPFIIYEYALDILASSPLMINTALNLRPHSVAIHNALVKPPLSTKPPSVANL